MCNLLHLAAQQRGESPHQGLGWLVRALAQCALARGRGTKGGPTGFAPDSGFAGDYFDMTLRRRRFEPIHKFGGWVTVLLSVGAIATGLRQANAPVGIWRMPDPRGLAVALAVATMEQRFGAPDTCQAI